MCSKILIIRSTSIIKDSRTIKYINEFLDLGYQVEVLGWDRKNEYDPLYKYCYNGKEANIYYFKEEAPYGVGIKNIPKFIKFKNWLKKQIKARDDNYIIHACDYDVASTAIKYKKNKKFVYDIFDYFAESRKLPNILKSYFKRKENAIINKADAVVICTEQRKQQIAAAKPKKIYIIHNTPNISLERFEFNLKSNEKGKIKVAYVGVLGESRLLKELLGEIKNYPQVELHIGGVGLYEEDVKKAEKELTNVFYYGSMPYEDVLKLESKCDILFATYDPRIPNHRYSAPNKFYEAAALSKPIIVCKNTGVDEAVEKYKMGMAINYDAKMFFDTIVKIGNDKNAMIKYGENGKDAYDKYFSWQKMKEEIKKLLKYIEELWKEFW